MKQILKVKLKENKQIILLKKQLVQIHKNYHMRVYQTLKKIYDMRLKENSNYTIVNLSQESTIKDLFSYDYVNTIIQIRRITPRVRKMIGNNKFTVFEVAHALRKSKSLHKPKNQDMFFIRMEKKVDQGLTVDELRENVNEYNRKHRDYNTRMDEDESWILQTVYEIRSVSKYIKERYNKVEDIHKIKIQKEVRELFDFINNKKVKTYSLIPISKNHLRMLRDVKIQGVYTEKQQTMIENIIEKCYKNDITKCKGCGILFTKKSRKHQVFHSTPCRSKFNSKISRKK